ncbi:MAG: winged helix DNA-binding domain-containing protein [Chloroflexota bacterium]
MRLRNQRLAGDKFGSAEDVVGWLGAVQSQEYPLARWSVGMRTGGLKERHVETAVAEGRILRTHVLRPTWHFILPRDIRWVMRLTAPRIVAVARRQVQLGLEAQQMARSFDLITDALAGGEHLTRRELGAAIARGGISIDGQRLAFIVMGAENELLVASGKPKGASQTYALLDKIAPERRTAAPFDREQAAADLAKRYFTGHGPATVGDFTWWSSLTVGDARRGIAANGSTLKKMTVEGTDFWWAGDTADGPDDRSPTIHLLQGYDEYIVAHRAPRDPINVERLATHAAMSRPPFLHATVLDGQALGFWRRVPDGDRYKVETKLLREIGTREKSALEAAVERYSAFVERPVRLA